MDSQSPLFVPPGGNPEPYPSRFTIAEASKATGKSTDQLRRAVKAGKIASTRDPANGAYLMTTEALLAAGIDLRPQPTATPAPGEPLAAKLEAAEGRIAELEADREGDRELIRELTRLIRDLPRAIEQARQPATPAPGEPLANQYRRRWFRKSPPPPNTGP